MKTRLGMPHHKAKIPPSEPKTMFADQTDIAYMLWNQSHMGFNAPQFVRLPPRAKNMMRTKQADQSKEDLVAEASSKIEGFRDDFVKTAFGLLGDGDMGIALPGQQSYTRGDKLASLRSQNQMLEKENIDLKRQLEDLRKTSSPKTSL